MRILATGSQAGLTALRRRECAIAPIYLFNPEIKDYNTPCLAEGMCLIPGCRRIQQGLLLRPGDARFEGCVLPEAMAAVLADPEATLVNRYQGSGTRVLMDRLLRGARPQGFWNQPSPHNAVAASIAQGRADWGMAIGPVAETLGLGFLPVADEHYDFAVWQDPRDPDALAGFEQTLAHSEGALAALGSGLA